LVKEVLANWKRMSSVMDSPRYGTRKSLILDKEVLSGRKRNSAQFDRKILTIETRRPSEDLAILNTEVLSIPDGRWPQKGVHGRPLFAPELAENRDCF
jgi:hypothetical protein